MNTASQNFTLAGEGPLEIGSRLFGRINSLWMRTYPFARLGEGISIHQSCEIERSSAAEISIGNNVYFGPKVWLDVAASETGTGPRIVIRDGCSIGRRCSISARNQVLLEEDVLLAPSVLITDHQDGEPGSGRIVIERNCWLGYGATVVCDQDEIRLGRNSVVGANAVITQSFPPYSIVVGNPGRIVKTYDEQAAAWVKTNETVKRG